MQACKSCFVPKVGEGIYHAPRSDARPALHVAAAQREETSVWILGVWQKDMIPGMRIPEIAVESYPSNGIEVSLTKQSNERWGNSRETKIIYNGATKLDPLGFQGGGKILL